MKVAETTPNSPTTQSYIFNLETTKIELHFDKADYEALNDEQRRKLKSAFLWSPSGNCWVSRAKEPNLWRPKQVAKELGFTEEEREGARLTYAEQLDRKTERAEARADRYEDYAANAEGRREQLQRPLNSMRGDNSFFTQPIIPGHSGSQAFARRRERMYDQYKRGFEEYRKSEYFLARAQTARETASNAQLDSPRYLDRRIKECKKTIHDREKNIIYYEGILQAVENGEEKKWHGGEVVTTERVSELIERELELVAVTMDKQGYLESCLEDLGGTRFSKDNIKTGYIVLIQRWGQVEIISAGPINVGFKILTGGAAGGLLQAAYAEIEEIIRAEEKEKPKHPFQVGEQFEVVKRTYYNDSSLKPTETKTLYEIVKASKTTISLKPVGIDDKPINRKPIKTYSGSWRFSINDTHGNTFYKEEVAQ